VFFCLGPVLSAQQFGGIRGTVNDADFDVPLIGVQVMISETGEKQATDDEGNFVFGQVNPGTYTLVFSKEGYTRKLIPDVVVSPGGMTDADTSLVGEFTEMEEFIVQDLELGGSTEIGLLNLRMESPSLMDSISSDLMSQAGASDAASALRLVSGATVEDGKYAVVRGLPDRYVNSQLNGVRLPTADADKRAVQLDQFPAALIDSIQVSKTFTPDQQGDASGGAVNLVLKGIPEEPVLKFQIKPEYNTQATEIDHFLTRGGVMGTSRGDSSMNYSGSLTGGGKHEFDNGVRIGALASMYYKRDFSYFEPGEHNTYIARLIDGAYTMVPYVREGYTSLYDVTEGVEKDQWGLLGAIGAEIENHSLSLLYMRTQVTEDKATLMEDTRGNAYFADDSFVDAPFHRSQTLEYTERTQSTIQLKGHHIFEVPEHDFSPIGRFLNPEIDWTVAWSTAGMDQPDKRVFSTTWTPERIIPLPFPLDDLVVPAMYTGYDPSGSGNGFAQRIWKQITEDSDQYLINGKLPFEQWSGDEGYLKVGLFSDHVEREYQQKSKFYEPGGLGYEAPWETFWSDVYATNQDSDIRTLNPSDEDVDYIGEQDITASYYMVDLPLCSFLNLIGGARYESTDLAIINHAGENAQYLPPGGTGWTAFGPEADVSYSQNDILPAYGIEVVPIEKVKVRASYSETVARQTFKELSPVMQMEYLGADIFVGNPELQMSALENYDIRFDYEPYPGGLFSASWFHKDVKSPIEYVQRFQASLFYTTPVNYPEGTLEGYELEVRQDVGKLWSPLEGFSVGANATFIDSEVTLPTDETAAFHSVDIPIQSRDMMNAPQHLYNFNLTYEHEEYGTQIGLFYTVRGDTLVEGGVALSNSYVPDVYEEEYGMLNLGLTQPLSEHCKIAFQVKNLTNPEIRRVYRSDYVSNEAVKTSYKRGVDLSLSLSYEF
jgi:hypothetical protein